MSAMVTETPEQIKAALASPQRAWRSLDPRAVAFCKQLSAALLKSDAARSAPALMALGFWFRDGGLRNIEPFLQHQRGVRMGRGLALHVTPANVDTVFMYSCLISLLMGNINFVRLSDRLGDEGRLLFDHYVFPMLRRTEFEEIATRLIFFTCPRNHGILAELSATCQLRVVWGGDETIRAIRAIALNPRAGEICFADRFSFSLISAGHVNGLAPTDLERLAAAFLSDVKLFGQQACSSPRVVFWLGDPTQVEAAKHRFWHAYEDAAGRALDFNPAERMARLVDLSTLAAQGMVSQVLGRSQHYPYRGELNQLDQSVRRLHGGRGLILEITAADIASVAGLIRESDQTLTVAGIDREALIQLIEKSPNGGLQRVVEIGHALDFYPIWDGQNLPELMSRTVSLLL